MHGISDLRPIGIGEILDRAIATYVRWFVPLFIIVALTAIPVALAQFAVQPGNVNIVADFSKIAALPPGDTAGMTRIVKEMSAHSTPAGAVVLFVLASFVLFAFSRTALIQFAAGILDGAPIAIGAAYRAALPRWFPQIIVAFAFAAIAVMGFFGVFIVAFVVTLAIAALALASRLVAVVVGVPIGIAAFSAFVCAYALIYIAWQMATVTVAVEDANPIGAIGRGLRRALDRTLIRRTLFSALSLILIDLFGSVAFLVVGALLVGLTHVTILEAFVTAFGWILIDGVRSLFMLVYTRDVRVRREGLDLLVAAEAPAPA